MKNPRSAFTLVEVLLVVMIIAALAALAAVVIFPAREEARIGLTKTALDKAMGALERYNTSLGEYPSDDQGLNALVTAPTYDTPEKGNKWFGPYLSASELKDAWDMPLKYKLEVVTDATSSKQRNVPHIYSFGPNKTDDNGDGDDIKNTKWADEAGAVPH